MKKKIKSQKNTKNYASVLSVLIDYPNKPLNYKQIGSKIPHMSFKEVSQTLEKLVREGQINSPSIGKYIFEKKATSEIEGTLDFNSKGEAYLVADNLDKDIKIKYGNTLDAFDGDLVKVKLSYVKGKSKPRAFVTTVIKRSREYIVGTLSSNRNTHFVVPDNNKIHTDFYIPKEYVKNAKNGDKVKIKFRDWPAKAKNPYARVIEVFGKAGNNSAEMHAIVVEFGFETRFSDAIEKAANQLPKTIDKEEIKNREDYRGITTFTVDPADAKDFDDALSFQELENGNIEIGVHIADVSHYVRPNKIIDKEAIKRATSVYLVDRTIPMLPEVLSNHICSLRPYEESLCFSVIFEFDSKANVKNYRFAKTIIYSDHRFSYEDAQQVIESGKGLYAKELEIMNQIASKLRKDKYENGAINFETTEFRFTLDKNGKPISVIPKVRKDAHKMIEEYMLLANKYVAKQLYVNNNKMPIPYRVHEEPSQEKLTEFAETALNFGFRIDTSNYKQLAASINKMVSQVQGTLEGDILQPLAIRSMEKAYYTTKKVGHFGLGFDYYAHFTSPIRRYPDLITHRMLHDYLKNKKSFDYNQVESMASHSSKQEQKATSAERASIKYKQVEYMSGFKGEEFEGIISGITEWGIYVEIIENKCEGMVRLRDIKGDQYNFYPDKKIAKGRRTGRTFNMGDKLWIRVKNTDLNKRNIDFQIIS
ncbi:MAG: ribonuclease R [Bacteroidetes bacterium]|nr:ribonuclease R [Bacteroidota bacterium]